MPAADGGQERLGDGHLAEEVHLELLTPSVERQSLHWATDRDAGVVDQRCQPGGVELDLRDRRGDRILVGDIEVDWPDVGPASGHECVAVLVVAHTSDDGVTALGHTQRDRASDSR